MADKDFGVKRINLVGAAGTPTITSPTDLIINANKVAISTNATVGGSIGIGTTNPTSKLWVNGDGYFVGVITAKEFSGKLDVTSAQTQSVGFATTANNLAGGFSGNIPYQSTTNTTAFVTNGDPGQVLISNGSGTPYWDNVSAASGSFGGITVRDENELVGTASSIKTLNFVGSNIVATATSGANGIATITISDDLVGTGLSISGTSTLGIISISSAGIVSSTTGTAVTFIGNLTGNASYATTAGIATNIVGGTTGSLPYQNSPGITSFVSGGDNNQVLLYDTDLNRPKWGSVSSAAGAGIGVKDEDNSIVTGIKTLNFRGDNITAVSDTVNGISTITISSNLVGTGLSISGISTFGTTNNGVVIKTENGVGIITSSNPGFTTVTYYGNFVGTASTAGYATTAFSLNGISEGNLSVAYAQTAGIASAVEPNSVSLGSDTTGDYVQSISGTSNQITVTSGTGEGSTPILSIPNQFTVPLDLTVTRDVQINRNLNVDGNITIGGTSAYILAESFRVSDADIILGFRTDAFGNDTSNDTTANHGGIAVASTEGTPLVRLVAAGIETLPATYKKIMWFKAGTFAGLGTDAWLSNYAIGIGSTQFPSGTRLAAGSVQFTENDLAVVNNINATGIITALEFSGKLNATSALAQSVGFATTANNLAGGAQGSLPYQNSSGITSFLSGASVSNKVLLYDLSNNKPYWGDVSAGSGAFNGFRVRDEGTSTLTGITIVDIFGSNISATSGGIGIASIRVNDNLVGTGLSISGISTFGTTNNGVVIKTENGVGIITSSNPGFTTVTFYGDFVGTASTAGYATTAFNLDANGASNLNVAYASTAGIATYATNAGIATNLKGGAAGNIFYQSALDTTNFVTNGTSGQVLISNGSSAPYWGNVSAASGSFGGISVRDEGDLVGSSSSITTLNFVSSNLTVTATSGANGIATITMSDNIVGTGLSISGSIGIGTTNPTSKLWVNGDGYFVGVVTSSGFYVNGELIGQGAITGGNIVGTGLSISGISTFGTTNNGVVIKTENGVGIITSSNPGFTTVTYYGNFVGTASTAGYATTAFNLDANGASNLNVAYASTAGIATYTSEWILGANGVSDYTFTGPGFTGAENDPVLYLVRGQQYKFTNTMGMHPFRIQSTVNGSVGTQYNDGITNNDVSNGTLTWDVQFDAPNLLYYQCTAHGGMGGKIYIIDAGIGPDISINTTGIITANSFIGDGSQLTGLTAGVSISTNTTNQAQYLTYVTGTGSTTGFGVTTTGLVFNPSTNNLGIGTTNPTSKLTVNGNISITGVTTSDILKISSSTASPNASVPVATLEAVGASSNYDIAIVPKGTGAIVASIPDGTSVGGNKRGTYAVDFQLSRSVATHVASGENSFIGNGHQNTASGNYSAVLNGSVNTSSATHAAISGGNYNTASGNYSFIGGGQSNSASATLSSVVGGEGSYVQPAADRSAILGGSWNSTHGSHSSILCASYSRALRKYSSVISGHWGDTRNTYGAVVFSGANESFGSGFSAGGGYQQARFAILSKATTNATPSTLTADGNVYDGNNVFQVVTKSAYLVKGSVIAYSNASDIARAWEFTAVIKNTSGVTLVGTPIINDIAYDSGASGWNLSITADAGTSSLKVEVTGQASTTIRWVTKMDATEVAFQ